MRVDSSTQRDHPSSICGVRVCVSKLPPCWVVIVEVTDYHPAPGVCCNYCCVTKAVTSPERRKDRKDIALWRSERVGRPTHLLHFIRFKKKSKQQYVTYTAQYEVKTVVDAVLAYYCSKEAGKHRAKVSPEWINPDFSECV